MLKIALPPLTTDEMVSLGAGVKAPSWQVYIIRIYSHRMPCCYKRAVSWVVLTLRIAFLFPSRPLEWSLGTDMINAGLAAACLISW